MAIPLNTNLIIQTNNLKFIEITTAILAIGMIVVGGAIFVALEKANDLRNFRSCLKVGQKVRVKDDFYEDMVEITALKEDHIIAKDENGTHGRYEIWMVYPL